MRAFRGWLNCGGGCRRLAVVPPASNLGERIDPGVEDVERTHPTDDDARENQRRHEVSEHVALGHLLILPMLQLYHSI